MKHNKSHKPVFSAPNHLKIQLYIDAIGGQRLLENGRQGLVQLLKKT